MEDSPRASACVRRKLARRKARRPSFPSDSLDFQFLRTCTVAVSLFVARQHLFLSLALTEH